MSLISQLFSFKSDTEKSEEKKKYFPWDNKSHFPKKNPELIIKDQPASAPKKFQPLFYTLQG